MMREAMDDVRIGWDGALKAGPDIVLTTGISSLPLSGQRGRNITDNHMDVQKLTNARRMCLYES